MTQEDFHIDQFLPCGHAAIWLTTGGCALCSMPDTIESNHRSRHERPSTPLRRYGHREFRRAWDRQMSEWISEGQVG